jgi:1,2-phenylacetyl-CoA epoxidase catalytic subunit
MTQATAEVHSFEVGDEFPEEYAKLLFKLLTEHGEVITSPSYMAFIQRLLEAGMAMAPSEMERVRSANFYAEEVRHGYIFHNLLQELGWGGIPEESSAVKFEAFNLPMDTWCDLAYLNCLTDRVGVYQAREWVVSSYQPLARISGGIVRDERGHSNLGYQRLKNHCKTEAGLREANEKLKTWWPAALDMFGRSDSRRNERYQYWGLKQHGNEELRQEYIAETVPLLADLGLDVPDTTTGRKYL